MPDLCPRCRRPLAEVGGEYHEQDPRLILECRETEIADLKAKLSRALVLLVKARDSLDLAIAEVQQRPEESESEGSGG